MALLKLSADGKASLVPIAILINGKFWDASAYKASPVPMALEPGTVYEAERTGSSLGLFTIGAALHSNAANASVPWLATGAYVPTGSDTGKKVLHAEATPVGIDNSDAPPRLTKNPGASAPASTSPTQPSPSSTAPSSSGSSAPSSGSSSGSSSGDEPPRLSRPASSQSPPADSAPGSSSTPAPGSAPQNGSGSPSSGQSPSNQNPSSQNGPSPNGSNQPSSSTAPQSGNKPADSKSDSKSDPAKSDTKSADRENVPTSDSGAGEANRPRLRRGKPATSFADEEIPGYSKPGGTPAVVSSVAAKPTPAAAAGPVQLIPAISDSSGPEPHSYGFEWVQGDEADRRKQLIALVQEQVRAYVDAQAKATVAPKTAPNAASRRAPAKKTPEPVLSNVQMTTYDLWSTNQPIVIFSADAQMPVKSAPPAKSTTASGTLSALPQQASPASSGAPSGPSSGTSGTGSSGDSLQYSVLIVACPDIYNNIHKLYAGVTDKYHLDITPRLELIDAVDADGDGRGELLFRETSDAGTGWVIYRANADKLWKMFDSLNPE